MHAFVLLALAAHPLWDDAVFSSTPTWQTLESGDPSLESRPVHDSAFVEFRASTLVPLPVERLCTAVFEWTTKGCDAAGIKSARLLRDGDNERVLYLQIAPPIASERDYAMTVGRRNEGAVCVIRFKATNELAPPLPPGVVRMHKLWGSWVFEPTPRGTRITYTQFADPAGAVTPFLAERTQKAAVFANLIKAVEKARASAP